MWPTPDDHHVVRRMRAAHHHASVALNVSRVLHCPDVWGWHGRTIGAEVSAPGGRSWLRIIGAPTDQIVDTFWNGGVDAQRCVPASIPRPRLRRSYDWTDTAWAYRAELYEYVAARTVADQPAITAPVNVPSTWWIKARSALNAIAVIPTSRITTEPAFLNWAMPYYLGISHSDYAHVPWTTAHGDLHFANLCAPDLTILDWEGWGLAPPGYDAATLHCYSLLNADAAHQVQRELAHVLTRPDGKYASLVVTTELLHAAADGVQTDLAEPLRRFARSTLDER